MNRIYLDNTPLAEALEKWKNTLIDKGIYQPLDGEIVKVIESLGRITAEAVTAKVSSPFYHSSAMDGYAVRFTDTFGASEGAPKHLVIPQQAVYISTGDSLPVNFNAVVMIEDVNVIRQQNPDNRAQTTINDKEEFIEIIKPVTPWQHVRTVGEDIVNTELILPENHRVTPVDIGAILAGGITEIRVRRKPKVVIIPTGNEIVEPGSELTKGNIIESNSRILSGLVTEWGGEPVRRNIVPDNIPDLKKAVKDACNAGDLVVINAGASAGKKDYTARVIKELGKVILHGINIKPGKPAILGWVNNKPVLGIPGYPVSAYITFELFAKPLIHTYLGIESQEPLTMKAQVSRQIASTLGIEEFIRVKVGTVGDNTIASPVSRGAGMLMSLVRADGFIRIPAMSEGLAAGSEVKVTLIKPPGSLQNTIVCIGSHDNILDLLANFLKRRYSKYSLSSAHVGSMGGLIALKRGEAHIAGTHLLDEQTGEYNVPFLSRLLPDEKTILINLAYRQQGLFVLRGNPKKINGFIDLKREDVTFINRQPGSGTRLLTDKYLKDLDIDSKQITGYDSEEYTHMTVASAVLNGIADTGLGILAASRALGLDFIPVVKERYDIAIPDRFIKLEMIQKMIDIIRNDVEFRNAVTELGGYDLSDSGKIVYSAG